MIKLENHGSNNNKTYYRLLITLFYILFVLLSFIFSSHAAPAKSSPQPMRYDDPRLIDAYRRAVLYFNPRLSYDEADTIVRALISYSVHYKLDPRFVVAVVAVESSFKSTATSRAGAQGLGQLMPDTAREMGIYDSYEPAKNLEGTVRYLKLNLNRWSHLSPQKQVELALASYNAGYNAVKLYGDIPPYSETKWYVYNVITTWRRLAGLSN